MGRINFKINDVVELTKKHPCGAFKWEIIRVGAEIRIKCLGCGHSVLMQRRNLEMKIKKIKSGEITEISLEPNLTKDRINALVDNTRESKSNADPFPFKDQSELHKLGYRITGLTREQRWTILINKALPKLGLENIVKIITSHIKSRERQVSGREKFKYAITEWKYDLKRLKEEYYRFNFNWPHE